MAPSARLEPESERWFSRLDSRRSDFGLPNFGPPNLGVPLQGFPESCFPVEGYLFCLRVIRSSRRFSDCTDLRI